VPRPSAPNLILAIDIGAMVEQESDEKVMTFLTSSMKGRALGLTEVKRSGEEVQTDPISEIDIGTSIQQL
jgi:hypothetical protein